MSGNMRTFVADGQKDRRTEGRSWLHRTRRPAGRVQKARKPNGIAHTKAHNRERQEAWSKKS
jgi:hypothetical protein